MQIGTTQHMTVDHIAGPGAYLRDEDGELVLLPAKEAGRLKAGEDVEAFVYRDSEDRPVATLKKPKIQLGKFAPLKVLSLTKIGAFLDWGLDKDLLLPYSEQSVKVMQNRKYFVQLYLDKSGRLAATMKVYPKLRTDSPYQKGDWTEGYVYQINPSVGAFVAVDNQYNGLIPKEDINDSVHNGESIKVRVVKVRPDGKLQLSPIKKAYKEINTDAVKILTALKNNGGKLPYNDKTAPEVIRAEFDISKGSFKKALGHLLKAGQIVQSEDGIELKDE